MTSHSRDAARIKIYISERARSRTPLECQKLLRAYEAAGYRVTRHRGYALVRKAKVGPRPQ